MFICDIPDWCYRWMVSTESSRRMQVIALKCFFSESSRGLSIRISGSKKWEFDVVTLGLFWEKKKKEASSLLFQSRITERTGIPLLGEHIYLQSLLILIETAQTTKTQQTVPHCAKQKVCLLQAPATGMSAFRPLTLEPPRQSAVF